MCAGLEILDPELCRGGDAVKALSHNKPDDAVLHRTPSQHCCGRTRAKHGRRKRERKNGNGGADPLSLLSIQLARVADAYKGSVLTVLQKRRHLWFLLIALQYSKLRVNSDGGRRLTLAAPNAEQHNQKNPDSATVPNARLRTAFESYSQLDGHFRH